MNDTAPSETAATSNDQTSFVRFGVAALLFDSSSVLSIGGSVVPGATARASDAITEIAEIGRYVTDNISLTLTAGIPPTASYNGDGTAAPFGMLGKATYGPAVLTAQYHVKSLGAFQPYAGIGGVYAVILHSGDGSVQTLNVHGSAGFVTQAGFDYFVGDHWGIFADTKKLFVSIDADGVIPLGPGIVPPVTAKVKLDPLVISTGIVYRF